MPWVATAARDLRMEGMEDLMACHVTSSLTSTFQLPDYFTTAFITSDDPSKEIEPSPTRSNKNFQSIAAVLVLGLPGA